MNDSQSRGGWDGGKEVEEDSRWIQQIVITWGGGQC